MFKTDGCFSQEIILTDFKCPFCSLKYRKRKTKKKSVEPQKTLNSQNPPLKQKSKIEDIILPDFIIYYTDIMIKRVPHIVEHTFNHSIGRQRQVISMLKAQLVYMVNSKTARTTLSDSVSNKEKCGNGIKVSVGWGKQIRNQSPHPQKNPGESMVFSAYSTQETVHLSVEGRILTLTLFFEHFNYHIKT